MGDDSVYAGGKMSNPLQAGYSESISQRKELLYNNTVNKEYLMEFDGEQEKKL